MQRFTISADGVYLKNDTQGFFHVNYTGYKTSGNPDYLNDLKNTFNSFTKEKLDNAVNCLYSALKNDLLKFDRKLTICVVPRSKAENTYSYNQLLFKKVVQYIIKELKFHDGSDYIVRHTDTKTTHLAHSQRGSQYAGNGEMPYPGITQKTCKISSHVKDKNILLIDDIYTVGVWIDEDAIQALLNNGAASTIFYAIGKTV